MTTVSFQLLVPFDGATVTGLDEYCTGGTHPVAGYMFNAKSPVDFAGPAGTGIVATCQGAYSARYTHCDDCVCSNDPGAPWDSGVMLEFYSAAYATGFLIGRVFYGHVSPIKADGTIVNSPSVLVGLVSDYCCNSSCCCDGQCNCSCCFTGPHVHMEVENVSYAQRSWLGCGGPYSSNQWAYIWTHDV